MSNPGETKVSVSENYAAPGRPGDHPFAVIYQGEYETPWDGTAAAVRLHARALALSGVPVLLKSFSGITIDEHGAVQPVAIGGIPGSIRQEIGTLDQTTASAFFPLIRHLVVRDAEHLRNILIPRGAVPRGDSFEADVAMRQHLLSSSIVYSVWERDRVDPGIVKILSRVAECWVPCEANRNMLINSGVPAEKVVVVPHPYDPEDSIHKLRRRPPDMSRQKRFYSIGRWEPRKGYVKLIEAFLRAFKASGDETLTIKYTGGSWRDYPTPEAAVRLALALPEVISNGWTPEKLEQRLVLREGRFPRSEILKLHYKNNLYVSSSHGEAWCLPAFEAALAGNRLAYVPSGGIEDFATDTDVPTSKVFGDPWTEAERSLEPVPRSYGWEADAMWHKVEVPRLVSALREVTAPLSYTRTSLTRFSLTKVGQLMRERVLAVASDRQAANDYYRGLK